MNRLVFILLLALIIAVPGGAFGQTPSGTRIGSETATFTFSGVGNQTNATVLGDTFEARISSNSSFVVQTILVEANSSAALALTVKEFRVYSIESGSPFVHNSSAHLNSDASGEIRAIIGPDILPLGVPEGGSLGISFEAFGMGAGDQVKITYVYIINAESTVSVETTRPGAQLPFFVAEEFEEIERTGDAANNSYAIVDNSFVSPEIHCESCILVEYQPGPARNATVAYTVNATDLSGATKLAFWALGSSGEQVKFMAAGKAVKGFVTYANTTQAALDNEWKRYEVDLAGADLTGITHLFGFSMTGDSKQTFYLKGISYY